MYNSIPILYRGYLWYQRFI